MILKGELLLRKDIVRGFFFCNLSFVILLIAEFLLFL